MLLMQAMPVSLVCQDVREKSFLLNLFDTPGHVNFSDEVVIYLHICACSVFTCGIGNSFGLQSVTEYLVVFLKPGMRIRFLPRKRIRGSVPQTKGDFKKFIE